MRNTHDLAQKNQTKLEKLKNNREMKLSLMHSVIKVETPKRIGGCIVSPGLCIFMVVCQFLGRLS